MQWKSALIIFQIFLMVGLLTASCQTKLPESKMNGISLVASRDSILDTEADYVAETEANYIALMPFAFLPDQEDPQLRFNIKRQWFGERQEGIEHTVSKLRERNLKIMVKPQIWIRNGGFTGDLQFETEVDWKQFEDSYAEFILLYAEISEELDVELLCIGTELFNFVSNRPAFWNRLISEVRAIYSGQITYAENWDKFDQTTIWNELDYIGVDAYFPISTEASPETDQIKKGWEPHLNSLETVSEKFSKQIIFTEFGYRSIDFTLKTPWNSEREHPGLNFNLQANAYRVIFDQIWSKDWFAGGFLWKWHQETGSGGLENSRFTPQNKPAEKVIKEFYSSFRN
ncbi:glycoside hydrolase family 113 [Christiangramia portivictoriae]|uniref:glycoside hydrolase family 113 n=1 Tax=Christiangramia portivictoriae TaxID=326069 RepID=UPI0005563B4A|nr:glycoside hydrolase [Christiangramia portivictoriae]